MQSLSEYNICRLTHSHLIYDSDDGNDNDMEEQVY